MISTNGEWLTLKEASDLLGVHPATLRDWADQGEIPVARTPGGHRRFRRSDVDQLLQPHQNGLSSVLVPVDGSVDRAIAHVRRDLERVNPFHGPGLAALTEEESLACRSVGRQLVHLAIQYIARRKGHEAILDQAAEIGRTYGQLCAQHRLDLSSTVRTFSLMREAVIDSICPAGSGLHAGDKESARMRREMREFFEAPFYTMLDMYDRSRLPWIEQA